MSGNSGVRVDRWTFPRVDLEVEVGDAELGVTGLPEEANCVTGSHRAELSVAVEMGVVVAVPICPVK